MAPGEADAALDLRDRLPDQTEGGRAMTPFVRGGLVELGASGLQGIEGRFHVRLVRTGFGGCGQDGGDSNGGSGGEELAARESRHGFVLHEGRIIAPQGGPSLRSRAVRSHFARFAAASYVDCAKASRASSGESAVRTTS